MSNIIRKPKAFSKQLDNMTPEEITAMEKYKPFKGLGRIYVCTTCANKKTVDILTESKIQLMRKIAVWQLCVTGLALILIVLFLA